MKNLALCLLVFTLPFSAQAEKRDRTVAEMKKSIHAKAVKIDKNKDGILSSAETAEGKSKLGFLADVVVNLVDGNGDGVVTVAEYEEAQVRELVSADRDQNGILTVSEQKDQKRALIKKLLN